MRVRAWVVAAGCAVAVVVTGCTGSSDSGSSSGETSQVDEGTGGSTDPSAAEAGRPERGTCWAVPASSVADQEYWFDDSARVPCTEPHTTETVMTFGLPEPTVDDALEALTFCERHVRSHLGVDPGSWVPWSPVAFLPSDEQVAAGASWVRCDVFFPATTLRSSARTTSVSAKGIADAPPADFWACTDKPPAGADQPFVPCDRPHGYEETGRLAILSGISEYPSKAELAAAAEQQCREGPPFGRDDVSVDAAWDPRSAFGGAPEVAGWCYMFNADGGPLPAR